MTTTSLLYVILYIAVLIFLIACAVRAVGYAKLPLHLRWELYPVPHEEKKRAEHGGSYFEAREWWTKPVKFNRIGELKSMLAEICFLKGLWEYKRKMWYRSYPFHLGLYLLIGTAVTLLGGAFLSVVLPAVWAGALGIIFHYVYTAAGCGGAVLTLWGAIALLDARLTQDDLKRYTTPGDIFNLVFFIVTVGFLAGGYLLRPDSSLRAMELAKGIVTFNATLEVPTILMIGLTLGALLTVYIPMTHMAHFIGKYFTYHAVRWDDEANLVGTKLEKRVAEYLTYRPTWAAPHMGADGTKSWAEIAMSNPAKGGKK
jgi:nitrate reductase gamma subunit